MKFFSVLFKIILLITVVYLIFHFIDIDIFLYTFTKLNYFFLGFVIFFIMIFLYTESLIFYLLLKNYKIIITKKENFMLLNFTYLFNLIFPFSGTAWRAFFLKKKHNFKLKNYGKVLLYFLLFELSLVFSILFLILISYFLDLNYFFKFLIIFFEVGCLYFFYFFILKIKLKIKNVTLILCLSIILILFYYISFYLSFLSLGINNPVESLIVSLTASFANYFSVTPSSIGILEGAVVFMSNFLSILPEESLVVSLIIRAAIFFNVSFFSLLFIKSLKKYF